MYCLAGIGPSEFISLGRLRHGLSSWDVYSTMMLGVPGAVAPLLFYASYDGLADKLNKFLQLFDSNGNALRKANESEPELTFNFSIQL